MNNFILWLEENGAYFPKVQVRIRHGIRGLWSSETISPNEIIIAIPDKCLIKSEDINLNMPNYLKLTRLRCN